MERLSVHQKSPKQSKAKKKPIKVVYISNPMRVKTSASEFRSLVQELTGKYSDVADNIEKYPALESAGERSLAPPPPPVDHTGPNAVYDVSTGQARPINNHQSHVVDFGHVGSPFEMLGEAFGSHEMLEDIPGFHYYDLPNGGVYRSFGGV